MDIPDEIIGEYKLREKATPDGGIYIKAVRGMYGLPQSSSNSHDELEEHLNKESYFKSPLVPALWKHKIQPTQFVLIVDDLASNTSRRKIWTISSTPSKNITTSRVIQKRRN
jgi:hypothetical protein